MRPFFRSLMAAALLSSGAAFSDTAAGKQLNLEGYELYKKNDFDNAREKFQAAVEAAPKLAIAHYNLAATMGRIGDGCRVRSDEILRELKRSIALDPKRLDRALVDPDFRYVYATVGWQRLLGADLQSIEGLTALLPKTHWRPPTDCGTDMGCGYSVEFLPGGKLKRGDRDAELQWRARAGTWRVEARAADAGAPVLQIVIDVPARFGLKAIHDVGRLYEDGRLVFSQHAYTDDPEGCCC